MQVAAKIAGIQCLAMFFTSISAKNLAHSINIFISAKILLHKLPRQRQNKILGNLSRVVSRARWIKFDATPNF